MARIIRDGLGVVLATLLIIACAMNLLGPTGEPICSKQPCTVVVPPPILRKVWYQNEWWFSVVDVVAVLTDSPSPRQYWGMLKKRLADEGVDPPLTDYLQLKMQAADGKMRTTDAATTQTVLRIIQSIPSPKAEPFKQWLAKVGTERLQEEVEPSLAEQRLIQAYRKKGHTDAWISQRLQQRAERCGRQPATGPDLAEHPPQHACSTFCRFALKPGNRLT